MASVVIVGGGQAGFAAAARLRGKGFDGKVTVLCAEGVPPYQRPPLSKAYLLGEMERERLYFRPEAFYSDNDIDLRLATPVDAIDAAARTVTAGDETIAYDELILATGSDPRRLPAAIGGNLGGVYTVRSLADVDAMQAEFREGARVLVIGGGYIGLEAAAVASKLGLKVTLIEMADRILQRVAAPETSAFFRGLHGGHGVDLREGIGLVRLAGSDRVEAAELSDGSTLDVDFVIVGVGISPSDRLAADAGLTVENGIAVDAMGRTSDPHIWAAGDCASLPFKDRRIRLESVQNAIDQAEAVADNIMGANTAYDPKPWFWSDQYDVKLQIAGLNTGYDRIVTRDAGDVVSFWYYSGDTLLAVDAMNDPRGYMVGKRLIEMGKSPDPALVADASVEVKSLLKG